MIHSKHCVKKTEANATDCIMVWKQLVLLKFWVCVSNWRSIWPILLLQQNQKLPKSNSIDFYKACQYWSWAREALQLAISSQHTISVQSGWLRLTSFRFTKSFRHSTPYSRSSGSSLVWELLGRAWTAARDSGVDSMGPILLSLCCCHSWLKPPSSASASSFWVWFAGAQRKKGI